MHEKPHSGTDDFAGSSLGGDGVAALCRRTPDREVRMILLKASIDAPTGPYGAYGAEGRFGPDGPLRRVRNAGSALRRLTGGRRRIWIMLGMVATTAVFLALPRLAPGSSPTSLYLDLAPAVAAFAATAMCRYAVRLDLPAMPDRERRRQNQAWILLGLATLSWGLGELVWTGLELAGDRAPVPSPADIGFLLCLPLMTAATVRFATVSGYPASWVRVLVDGVVVALSLFGIIWSFPFGSFLLADPHSRLEKVIVTAYPVADVLALAIALAGLAHSRRRDVASFALVTAGILGLGVSDLGFMYRTQAGGFESGTSMDLGWLIGFFLVGLAALYRPEKPPVLEAQPEDLFMREVLPYGAAAALLLVSTAYALVGRPVGRTLIVVITVVVLMNMIKQIPLRRAKAEVFAESQDTARLSHDVVWVTEAVAADLAWLQEADDLRAGTPGLGSGRPGSIDLDVLTMRALYASRQAEKLNLKTLGMQQRIRQCLPAHRIPIGRASAPKTRERHPR
jgi:hypothetical protein